MTEGIKSISVRRTRPHAWYPRRAKRYDVGYDMFSAESFTLEAGEVKLVPTGIAIDIPVGWVGQVCPRSGLAFREWVTVHNGPGIIDPTYDGEVKVLLHNARPYRYEGKRFDAIAQLVIVQAITPELVPAPEAWERDEFSRGLAGFGSTGR